MTQTQWHAGKELLAKYAASELDDVAQAAVETHLTGCQTCRDEATALVAQPPLAQTWEGIATAIATPRTPLVLRLLRRLGVHEPDIVVLRTSANLAVPFVVALVAAVVFAIASAYLHTDDQQLFYLAIAPLLPAVLVSGAYDTTDPIREVGEATPLSKLRIALLRTAASVSCALPLMLLMALVPNISLSLSAWLVPSLTLAVVALALLTWLTATVTVTTVSVVWLGAVTLMKANGSVTIADSAAAQAVFAIVLLLAATVFVARLGLLPARGERS